MHFYDGRFGKSGRFCYRRPTRLFYHEILHNLINIINTSTLTLDLHIPNVAIYPDRVDIQRPITRRLRYYGAKRT